MNAMYKVSIVIPGHREVGGIQNMDTEPKPGDIITMGTKKYEIIEVDELMPPRGDFAFLHATCKPAKD